jgi:hypothetical protein
VRGAWRGRNKGRSHIALSCVHARAATEGREQRRVARAVGDVDSDAGEGREQQPASREERVCGAHGEGATKCDHT